MSVKTGYGRKWAVVVAGGLLGSMGLACEKLSQMTRTSATPATQKSSTGGGEGVAVTVADAVKGDVDVYIDEIGTATAVERVGIKPQVSGPLIDVRVKDGQVVKKDELLFVIDKRPYEAALLEAKANLRASQTDLASSERDLKRLLALPAGAASAQDVDTAQAAVDRFAAQVSVNDAKIRTAEINLSYTEIHSPIDGRMGRVLVTVGNIVSPGSEDLADIRSVDPIYVDFSTPEKNLGVIRDAMKATANPDVEVRVQGRSGDLSKRVFTGKLSFVDNQVQADMGQISLRALVPNTDQRLWPGQFVEVRLKVSRLENATIVPAEGVEQAEGGARTYVVKADGTAELRRLKLGQRQAGENGTEDKMVVLEGISPGEQVVVKGRWLLGPGAKVRVVK